MVWHGPCQACGSVLPRAAVLCETAAASTVQYDVQFGRAPLTASIYVAAEQLQRHDSQQATTASRC